MNGRFICHVPEGRKRIAGGSEAPRSRAFGGQGDADPKPFRLVHCPSPRPEAPSWIQAVGTWDWMGRVWLFFFFSVSGFPETVGITPLAPLVVVVGGLVG